MYPDHGGRKTMAIDYKKENKMAIFTINRPEVANTLSVQAFEELYRAIIDFRDDDDLLVGIITGSGDKVFCGGVDIKDFLPGIKKTINKPWKTPDKITRRLELWKPMIAAINGVALGGGVEIALFCDIRVASENASLGFPEVTLGFFPGGGGTQRLPRLIPPALALEMLFTGKRVKAQEALNIGLVNRVVPVGMALVAAKELAGSICQAAPLAVRGVKESVLRGINMGLDDGLRLEESIAQNIYASKDFAEGIAAFAEKRKPDFKGM
jgi:enoyl-CoA hydratase/carnithine racemase